MPPKRSARKAAKKTAANNGEDSLCSKSQHLCDGCAAPVQEGEALFCSSCNICLHRYCAGIPRSHYPSISSSFICIACSMAANKAVISELRGEIAALKAELLETRSALKEIQLKSCDALPTKGSNLRSVNRAIPSQSFSEAVRNTHATGARAALHQPNVNIPQGSKPSPSHGPATGKVLVEGARRIWGTMKASSISATQGTICKLTSLKDKLQIKRKTKALTNNKLTWWFVIHG